MGNKKDNPKGQCMVKRLQYGDYVIGQFGVEAKEINDLYRSILGIGRNGRTIKHQLHELCEIYETPILAVYNTQLKPYFHGRKPKRNEIAREILKQQQVIKSFKMNLYSNFPKIRLIEFNNMDDFVYWLGVLNTQHTINKRMRPKIDSERRIDDPRLLALMGINGCTERIAEDLLEEFGSIRNMLKSKVKLSDFRKVKGVGLVLARRLRHLRQSWV